MASVVTKEMQGRGQSIKVVRRTETQGWRARRRAEGPPRRREAHPNQQAGDRHREEGAEATLEPPVALLSFGESTLVWRRVQEHRGEQLLRWGEGPGSGLGAGWGNDRTQEGADSERRMGRLPVTKRGQSSPRGRASPARPQASHPRSEEGPN